MKKAEYVELCDGRLHGLEQIRKNRFKMWEISGEIVFCESRIFPEGSSLVMKLKDSKKEVHWGHESKMPLPALVGQTLRGFYEKDKGIIVDIDAYELSNGSDVLRRGAISNDYTFILGDENAA